MFYVYLIRSLVNSKKTYVGYTTDLDQRMENHNSGGSVYTRDFRPWRIVTYICFDDEAKARSFEQYLKIGSGSAFAKRIFW